MLIQELYITPSSRWVIYLKGGEFCFDSYSCEERYNSFENLVSTESFDNENVSTFEDKLVIDPPSILRMKQIKSGFTIVLQIFGCGLVQLLKVNILIKKYSKKKPPLSCTV